MQQKENDNLGFPYLVVVLIQLHLVKQSSYVLWGGSRSFREQNPELLDKVLSLRNKNINRIPFHSLIHVTFFSKLIFKTMHRFPDARHDHMQGVYVQHAVHIPLSVFILLLQLESGFDQIISAGTTIFCDWQSRYTVFTLILNVYYCEFF